MTDYAAIIANHINSWNDTQRHNFKFGKDADYREISFRRVNSSTIEIEEYVNTPYFYYGHRAATIYCIPSCGVSVVESCCRGSVKSWRSNGLLVFGEELFNFIFNRDNLTDKDIDKCHISYYSYLKEPYFSKVCCS